MKLTNTQWSWASGCSVDCTQLWRVSNELMGSWVLNYGHCPVSSLTPEYWAMDTLRWADAAEYWAMDTLGWAHWELSIELQTLSSEPIQSWVFSYGHCWVGSWSSILDCRHCGVSSESIGVSDAMVWSWTKVQTWTWQNQTQVRFESSGQWLNWTDGPVWSSEDDSILQNRFGPVRTEPY